MKFSIVIFINILIISTQVHLIGSFDRNFYKEVVVSTQEADKFLVHAFWSVPEETVFDGANHTGIVTYTVEVNEGIAYVTEARSAVDGRVLLVFEKDTNGDYPYTVDQRYTIANELDYEIGEVLFESIFVYNIPSLNVEKHIQVMDYFHDRDPLIYTTLEYHISTEPTEPINRRLNPFWRHSAQGQSTYWRESWMGWVFCGLEDAIWIFHNELGWLYCLNASTSEDAAVFLWSESMGFMWTQENCYPYAYVFNDSQWITFTDIETDNHL